MTHLSSHRISLLVVLLMLVSIFGTSCQALVLPTPAPTATDQPQTEEEVAQTADLPIFDTHVHYSQHSWERFPPDEVIAMMERVNVSHALVSSSPDEGTIMLYERDPERIVPSLRPYHGDWTTSNWYRNVAMGEYLAKRLARDIYVGIGEFHLHTPANTDDPIVQETIRLALEHDLYLHIHTDAATVRAVFAYEPRVKVLWAHAGLTEPPSVVSAVLDEFENLWTDISIREGAIAPGGVLAPEWESLFLRHPDRITIGSDTWVPQRWGAYEEIIQWDRDWLNQLPRDVAEQIAYQNAERLFGDAK